MIRLAKRHCPEYLAQNAEDWTHALLSAIASGRPASPSIRFRYRDGRIKSALRSESWDKCVYCESKVSHNQPGETDHYVPFSAAPELNFEWQNLVHSCKTCNTNKGAHDPRDSPILNPFVDDPSLSLRFAGPMLSPVLGDSASARTVLLLKLNRAALIERRQQALASVDSLMREWHRLPDGADKDLAHQALSDAAAEDKEFSATIRAFLLGHGVPLP